MIIMGPLTNKNICGAQNFFPQSFIFSWVLAWDEGATAKNGLILTNENKGPIEKKTTLFHATGTSNQDTFFQLTVYDVWYPK